jgi:NADH:ubiquinone oxidoreductase subunit 6 (subunit J)
MLSMFFACSGIIIMALIELVKVIDFLAFVGVVGMIGVYHVVLIDDGILKYYRIKRRKNFN